MKPLLSLLFLSVTFSLYSQDASQVKLHSVEKQPVIECDQYWYVAGGIVYIAPSASLGYRFQRGKFGGDTSLSVAILPYELIGSTFQISQLYYPRPNINHEWYVGVKEGVCYVHSNMPYPFDGHLWDGFVGVVGGYQFRSKKHFHFIQGDIAFPIETSIDEGYPFPMVSISFGASF